MCGIVGVISKNCETDLLKSLEKISHRGPDSSGNYVFKDLGLGHKRLAIQDVSSNGNQPMISDCGNYIIIFNGEIYNHHEIRVGLQSKFKFKSQSDTETLLYGFMEYGSDILNKLNGIFAFSVFNKKTNKLFIARDQFGVKPLYYYSDPNLFWFSSEIKSILPLKFNNSISKQALFNYLTFLYSPAEKTPFKNVLKLLPGHYIELDVEDHTAFSITNYYDIPFNGTLSKKSEKELIDELEQKLIKAVDRQLLSDVPVGFFLSGGLDSSAIVAIARKLHPDKPFDCYTIKTKENQNAEDGFADDLPYARLVAEHLKVNLIEVESSIDIVRQFDKMIYHLDEPQADPAPLNVLQICEQARKDGCVVLLGGAAGDDLFSGYRRHQALYVEKYLRVIPMFTRKIIHGIVGRLPQDYPFFRRMRKLTQHIHLSKEDRLVGYFSWLKKETLHNLFSEKNKTTLSNHNPTNILKEYLKNIPDEKTMLNQMLYLEMKFFLVDHNLNYTDKMSMATGVEVRVPFLDKELVEFSCTIPTHLKMKGVTTKYLLKKVMEKYLPHSVIYRPKSGFGAPIREWIKYEMDNLVKEYLSGDTISRRKIFSFYEVQQLIDDNKTGKIDASYTIWSLLSIESWMRQFYDTTK